MPTLSGDVDLVLEHLPQDGVAVVAQLVVERCGLSRRRAWAAILSLVTSALVRAEPGPAATTLLRRRPS